MFPHWGVTEQQNERTAGHKTCMNFGSLTLFGTGDLKTLSQHLGQIQPR
jgi:hypothetical protein